MAGEIKFHLGIKAIIRNAEGRLLLLKSRRERAPGPAGPACWDFPGGRVEWGSAVRDAATGKILWEETERRTLEREVEEETGLTGRAEITPFSFVFSNLTYPAETGETVALLLRAYLCSIADLGTITLSDEHAGYGWFPPQEAAALLSVKYPGDFCEAVSRL